MSYKAYFWVRFALAVALLGYAGCTVARFASLVGVAKSSFYIGEVVFWTIGPSTWFFLEYFAIDREWIKVPVGQRKDEILASTKIYADYASKIWAAVLAAVVFLYAK